MVRRYSLDIGPLDVRCESPLGHASVLLEYAGEIRFGPPYFRVWLERDGEYRGPDADEFYGDKISWSPDGRYVALERWFSLESPETALILLDTVLMQLSVGERIPQGFVGRILWKQSADGHPVKLTYSVTHYAESQRATDCTRTVMLEILSSWVPLHW